MADTLTVPLELKAENPNMAPDTEAETQRFMQKVYGWMAFALVVSGATAWYIANDIALLKMIFEGGLFTPLLLIELGLVIGLSWLINKINAVTAMILFVLYSFVTGLTLSVIFLVYQLGSIVSIFGVTALIFGAMSTYWYFTKRDLTGIGTLAIFGLFGIVIAGIINLFIRNSMADFIINVIWVVVFIALTAYDTQKSRLLISSEMNEQMKIKRSYSWSTYFISWFY